jgi:membrane-bound hydrogenase subunit beta
VAKECNNLVEAFKRGLKEGFLGYEYDAKKRVLKLFVEKGALSKLFRLINEICGGEHHVTTITGADLGGEEIELTYFSWLLPQRLRVVIKTRVPKRDSRVQSLVGMAPALILYEREVYEMLGVTFEGHPKLEKLFLPEDWPEGVYPLRRG